MPITRSQLNNNLSTVLQAIVEIPAHLQTYQMILDYLDQEIAGVATTLSGISLSNYYTKTQVDTLLGAKLPLGNTVSINGNVQPLSGNPSYSITYASLSGSTPNQGNFIWNQSGQSQSAQFRIAGTGQANSFRANTYSSPSGNSWLRVGRAGDLYFNFHFGEERNVNINKIGNTAYIQALGESGSFWDSMQISAYNSSGNQPHIDFSYFGVITHRFANSGNILLGKMVDDGVNRLQVSGSTKISSLAGTGERFVIAQADGTLVASSSAPSGTTGGGGTTITGLTPNGVVVANSSTGVTTYSGMTYDGSNIGMTGSSISIRANGTGQTLNLMSNGGQLLLGETGISFNGAMAFNSLTGTTGYRQVMADNFGQLSTQEPDVKLLTTQSFSGTSWDVVLTAYTATYKKLVVRFFNIASASSNEELHLRVSSDGSTFDSGASDYDWGFNYGGGGIQGQVASYIKVADSFSNTAGSESSGDVIIYNPTKSTAKPHFRWEMAHFTSDTHMQILTGAGFRNANQQTKAIRFLSNGGVLSGLYELWGHK